MTRYATKTTAMIGSSAATEWPCRTVLRNQLRSLFSFLSMVVEVRPRDRTESFKLLKQSFVSRVFCDCRERPLLYEAARHAISRQNSQRLMRAAHGFSPRRES